jgi:CHAD domain-containing protein
MLKAKKQRDAFNTAWENLTDYLWCFYYDRDPSAVHQARVAIKRMKAQLLMFQALGDAADMPPAFDKVQKIFKHLGRIRSAQIHLARLDGYGMTKSEYGRKLHYIQTIETRRFADRYRGYTQELKKSFDVLEAGFSDLENALVANLIRKELRAVDRFFEKPYKYAEDLHDIRKRIKNLLYVYPVLPKELRNKLQLNTIYLDQLQEAIGKWHDAHDVLEELRSMGYKEVKVLEELAARRTSLREAVYNKSIL